MKKTILTAVLLLAGCEAVPHYDRVKVTNLNGRPDIGKVQKADRRPYGSVKLYQGKEEVTQPYEVLALMSVEGKAGEESDFITAFLFRAADMGADGLILYRVNLTAGSEGGGFILGKSGGFGIPVNSTQEAFYRAEAIRMKP